MSIIICLVTCPSREVASSMAKDLVGQQLAACVNVLPAIESTYRWQGDITVSEEALMIIKSTSERQDELSRAVLSKHPYEVPEFVVLDTVDVSEPYARWILESVGHKKPF